MTYDIAGKVVLITGATGGFAQAILPALRARGARLALLDLDQGEARRLAAKLGSADIVMGWACDVRCSDAVRTVVADVAAHFGKIDIAIANAAILGLPTPLAHLSAESWERRVDVGLNGVFHTFQAAFPHVSAQRGYMLAISSMAGFIHGPFQGPYPALKAALWALCNTWRLEAKPFGVSIGSHHSTFFLTPMVEDCRNDPAGAIIWGNHRNGGPWRLIPIDVVVEATINGIERRARRIFVPNYLRAVAMLPLFCQRYLELTKFSDHTIRKALRAIRDAGRAP